MKENIWFPDDDRLSVVASVVEKASGQIETSTDTSIHFSKIPYRITFKRSIKYIKPKLPYEAQVGHITASVHITISVATILVLPQESIQFLSDLEQLRLKKYP